MLEQLSSEISPFILGLILKYKYIVLFPILVAEGPIITIFVGALATPEINAFALIPLFFFVVFSDLCGDTFYYLLGRFAGEKVLKKFSEKKHIDYNKKISNYFDKYGGRTLVISKVSHGLGWPVMVFAGSIRMNYLRFMTACTLTSFIKSTVLIGIGYVYSDNYKTLIEIFGSVSSVITVTALSVLLLYISIYYKHAKPLGK